MGRGYSVNRTSTQRPSNKDKRPRSVSLNKLRTRLGTIAAQAQSREEMAQQIAALDSDEELMASEDEAETVKRPDVLTKYKMCGVITDEVIATVVKACRPQARTIDLCALGDNLVLERVKKMFQKSKSDDGKRMLKGLSFPTTVSVNNVLANASPLNEAESTTLAVGDVVKVAVSVHLDGYATSSAATIVVGLDAGEVQTMAPEVAHVIAATHYAIHGMIRLMKPGVENQDITDFIRHVATCFNVEPVEGVLSNRTKRWILDGNECIICRRVLTEDPQQNVGDCVVEENQVWTLDVAFTTSPNYRLKQPPLETNIFRRNEVTVEPRLQAAKDAIVEIRETAMCFPFTPSRFANPLRTRLGITELKKHDMLDSFPVLSTVKGAFTARHSCTVAVTEKRVNIVSGAPAAQLPDLVASSAQMLPSPDVLELMSEELYIGDAKPKVKKGAKATAAAPESADAEDDADARAALPTRSRKVHRSGV